MAEAAVSVELLSRAAEYAGDRAVRLVVRPDGISLEAKRGGGNKVVEANAFLLWMALVDVPSPFAILTAAVDELNRQVRSALAA